MPHNAILAYHAYATKGRSTAPQPTPRAAANAFFARYPRARKCTVQAGLHHDGFFTVVISNRFAQGYDARVSRSWENVSPKGAAALPDTPCTDRFTDLGDPL
ncbi:MAG TPA: hypothetical protein VFQ88_07310 [Nevskiaceae bacterium]|nr:hypothetical protein [Nevskiaceae bacterium]